MALEASVAIVRGRTLIVVIAFIDAFAVIDANVEGCMADIRAMNDGDPPRSAGDVEARRLRSAADRFADGGNPVDRQRIGVPTDPAVRD